MVNLYIMTDRIHELLNFWFGKSGFADLPTSDRTNLWFGDNDVVKKQLQDNFSNEFELARKNQLSEWGDSPRGRLALILLFDQFPRYFFRQSADAFAYDKVAQQLSIEGIEQQMDHTLTLIERVFFYMPLVHSENNLYQEKSIRLYQELVMLSMSETTQIYELFHAYARAHFRVIKEFGRFPQRNKVLGRETTQAEMTFLKST